MATTIDRRVLGQRVAYWRTQRRLTQQELADRLGRPRNWVWKIESGSVGSLERYSTLVLVADALTVDMQVLLGRDLDRQVRSTECIDLDAVDAIRTSLERYDALTDPVDDVAGSEPPALAKLERQADYLWAAFDHGRYGVVSSSLPQLLSAAQRAHGMYPGDDGATAAALLAQAYQLSASVLRKLGEHQLGWFAADRAIQVVNLSGDICWHGVASFRVGNALLAMGRVDAALQVQLGAVNRLSPDLPADDTDGRMSVYGIVLLQAAMAAARKGDSATTGDMFKEAGAVASRIGTDAMHYRSMFGPTNLGIHRTSAAVEVGEGAAAVKAHEGIDAQALGKLPAERRANHVLDVARGYAQWGQPDRAAEFLVAADALCPAEVRCRPVAQSVLRELSRRRKVDNLPAPLRDLAAAVEMPA